ncbi:MAG: DUF2189 domain-containing protein [Steroidobacteraceae bacterium]
MPEADRPFVVPCTQLDAGAPRRWLRLGWQDLQRAPALSLLFGATIMLFSIAVSAFAWYLGRFALLATLLSGFIFIAPLLAVGLYCVSRELESRREPTLRHSFTLLQRVVGQAGIFALALLVILLLWSRAGMMVSAFFPIQEEEWESLFNFLALGSLFGSIFASLTFAITVFSLPMIADRDVDMITACVSSINAVLRNKRVMILWATIIALLTLIGFATAFIGLIVIMPWLAYSAWHSYRETLDASAWPPLE